MLFYCEYYDFKNFLQVERWQIAVQEMQCENYFYGDGLDVHYANC